MIDRACVSLTDACNLSCRYCHFRARPLPKERLAKEDALRVLGNFAGHARAHGLARFKVGIVGSGEPLLELDTVVAMAKFAARPENAALRLYTITNGTLLDEKALERLAPFAGSLRVCVSVDGPAPVHDAGRAMHSKAMEGVRKYAEAFGEPPPINATVSRVTVKHADEVIKFFLENGLRKVTFSRIVGCDPGLAVTKSEFADFLEMAGKAGIRSRQLSDALAYDCTMYGRLCGVGRTNVFVARRGIYPCGRFYGLEAYRLGGCLDPLSSIEERMSRITPVEDGKCYYEERVTT